MTTISSSRINRCFQISQIIQCIKYSNYIVDTAISTLGGGTSQPPTESMVRTFMGSEYRCDVNYDVLRDIADYFKPIREKYLKDGIPTYP